MALNTLLVFSLRLRNLFWEPFLLTADSANKLKQVGGVLFGEYNLIMGYEILSHTADLRIRVWGKGREGLFQESLRAMMHILKSEIRSTKYETKKRNIKIQSSDQTALLVDFLNEALTLSQTNREIYSNVNFKKLSETELEAELSGFPVKKFAEDIKAVTYHEAEIRKNEKGEYETLLVFDI